MKEQQTSSNIMMVRPASFGYNEETAKNNSFQTKAEAENEARISKEAIQEFDMFVEKLKNAGVNIIVIQDTLSPRKPDSIFPNNWISTHSDGNIFLYPMYAKSRRLERQNWIVDELENQFTINGKIHFEQYENEDRFLEGTGSMILDRPNKIVYACLSPRTDKGLLEEFGLKAGYKPVVFHSVDSGGKDIYHTNVMMAVGETFVVICLDTIKDYQERKLVIDTILNSGKSVIDITIDQMNSFAGNMLQVRNNNGELFLVMSQQAYQSLTPGQIALIEVHSKILYSSIKTIETYGGGSARCMMAEIFLPTK